jgi:ligand-binding SRPBCC domain-containing protein
MSKQYHLESSFWIPVDIEDVWAFGSRPKNLAKISPPEMNVKVDHDGPSYEGLEIEIKIKPWFSPITIRWGSRIENVVPVGDERSFEDVQLYGPFKYWRHTHKFVKGTRDAQTSTGETVRSLSPGTWIIDSIVYEMPLGVLGMVAREVAVAKILGNMFRDRKKATAKFFEDAKAT